MAKYNRSVVLMNRHLRLADNPAYYHATKRSGIVLPLFAWTQDEQAPWAPGAASRWYLHHSLSSLDRDLRNAGSRLFIVRADSLVAALKRMTAARSIDAVFLNAPSDPADIAAEDRLAQYLEEQSVARHAYASALLHDPASIETTAGSAYRVFTPFWRKVTASLSIPEPLPVPEIKPTEEAHESDFGDRLDALELLPQVPWDGGLYDTWQAGEAAAHASLSTFCDEGLNVYDSGRDRPDRQGTSRLSPRLHFGELSPRQVWRAAKERASDNRSPGTEAFLREIGWREFAAHVLYHYPHTSVQPLNDRYKQFPWRTDEKVLRSWEQGQTGYPLVDAGMRELRHTGWMHNRIRMVVASFLTKHLMIHWLEGARWFWNTLVDADLASNTMGWQWAAGCGADAQPFFRIFNPITQAKRFDPDARYVKKWVPELRSVPVDAIFTPWESVPEQLDSLGYPAPIVDHADARNRALSIYNDFKNRG